MRERFDSLLGPSFDVSWLPGLGSFAYVVGVAAVLIWGSGLLRRWVADVLLARRGVELGLRQSIGSIVRYSVLALGLLVALQTAGIDLRGFTVLAGALGIGVGFGLQNISNNFISGLILLLERPVQVGDRIEVGPVHGLVVDISARATTVVTNDNISIIVPNSELISSKVVNWSHGDTKVRFRIPVGVAYGSDPETVERLLLAAAEAHPGVLKEPAPKVQLRGFGDSSLDFELRVWTRDYAHRPGAIKSDLNIAILKGLGEEGVEIPFPQRDVRVRILPGGDGRPEGGMA